MDPSPVVEDHAPNRVLIRSGSDEADDLGPALEFRTGRHGRRDAGLIEGDATRRERPVEPSDGGESATSLVSEPADDALVHRHLVLGEKLVQDAELVQPGNAAGPDPVGGDRRAGELVAVDDQHVPVAAGEPDGQRRARASSADDDRVVLLHGGSLARGYGRPWPRFSRDL